MVAVVELHLLGGTVRVHHHGPCPWMKTYDAFRTAHKHGQFEVELVIEVGDPQRDAQLDDFIYKRMDLSFGMNADRTRAHGISNGSESAFLALLELTLQGIVSQLGGVLVHSAGCVTNGEAWLIPGPSGTGKSTAAREAGFSSILSDERVGLMPSSEGWRVWGTPFWSEGRTLPMEPGSKPLGGLIKLVKHPHFESRELEQGTAFVWLMESITLYDTSPSVRTRAFEIAHQIVTSHPSFEINTPRQRIWARPADWLAA